MGRKNSRELIAFAFVEDAYIKTGDITLGLLPLFRPILAKYNNKIFDPKSFSKDVGEYYGIPMSTIVAEGLIPKFIENRLLYQDEQDVKLLRVSAISSTQENADVFDEIFKIFKAFSRQRIAESGVNLNITDNELEDALLERLSNIDFMGIIDEPTNSKLKPTTLRLSKDEQEPDNNSILDTLFSIFILDLYDNDKNTFDKLSKIVSGALIAEVILTLSTPDSVDVLSNTTVVLDSPLLLDAFNLNTPENYDFANELFEILNKTKIRKITFLHLVDEMKHSIGLALESYSQGYAYRGMMSERIRSEKGQAFYTRTVLENIESKLHDLGIEITDANDYLDPKYLIYCSEDLKDSIRNNVGEPHENVDKKINDALSISTILKMRASRSHPKNIVDAGYIHITRNSLVAKGSRRCLIHNKVIYNEDIPPSLTDRQIAGILWFAVGGSIGSISHKKLISNCTNVVHPSINLISKIAKTLKKPEDIQKFEALMKDDRARRCLIYSTLGSSNSVSAENSIELLEKLINSTIEDESKKHEEEINEIVQSNKETILDIETKFIRNISDKNLEILQLQKEINETRLLSGKNRKELDYKINLLKTEKENLEVEKNRKLGEFESYKNQKSFNAVLRAANYSKKQGGRLRFLIVLVVICIVLASFRINGELSLYLGGFLTVISFWIVPNYLFDKPVYWYCNSHFNKKAKEYMIENELGGFKIDPVKGIVENK